MDYEKNNAADWDLPDDSIVHDGDTKASMFRNPSDITGMTGHNSKCPTNSFSKAADRGPSSGQDAVPGLASSQRHELMSSNTVVMSQGTTTLSERQGGHALPIRGSAKPREQQNHNAKWPKIRPENDWSGRQEERLKKEEHRKAVASLRRRMEDDRVYGHRGVYILPPDYFEAQALSRAIETLSNTNCQLKYQQTLGTVEAIADNAEQIQKSLKLVRAKLTSISSTDGCHLIIVTDPSKCVSINNIEVSMVDATAAKASPKAVGLNRSTANSGRNEKMPYTSFAGTKLQGELGSHRRLTRNLLAMRIATEKTIKRLLHRRGFVEMRLNFGALVYHRYQWPRNIVKQPADRFIESLKDSRTEASLYMLHPDVNLREKVSNVLHHFTSWSSVNTDPRQTSPIYIGRFFWHRDKENKPPWVFEARTEPISISTNSKPKIDRMNWLPPSYPGSQKDLELFVTQLNGGISSALQITSEPDEGNLTKYPQQLTAQQIQILHLENYATAASKGHMIFNAPKAGCHDYRQRTIWRFRLKADPRYIFELIRHNGYRSSRTGNELNLEPIETRWSASVYSEEWEWIFANNNTASAEEGARWDPTIDTFFPKQSFDAESSDGFERFARWVIAFLEDLNSETEAE